LGAAIRVEDFQPLAWEGFPAVIIDPHIAIIRTPEGGQALYDGVMRRVANRAEQPQGVLFHYSAVRGDRFIVGTVFRDNAAMLDGFIGFSAPEAQNEMVATGNAIDLTRDEYPLERMLVSPDVETHPFSLVPAGEIIACTSENAQMTIEHFRTLVRESGQLEAPVPGRLASIAYRVGDYAHAVDFWQTRDQGERWYDERVHPVYEKMRPGRITAETREASWMPLHTFLVAAAPEDSTRDFTRSADGPSQF
jgi:hypothetical protein